MFKPHVLAFAHRLLYSDKKLNNILKKIRFHLLFLHFWELSVNFSEKILMVALNSEANVM